MDKAEAKKILEEGVREYCPVVAEFFGRRDNIIDYAKSLYDFEIDPTHRQRQEVFNGFVEKEIERVFGLSSKVDIPFATNIVDHHAILNHPILLATNIVGNAHRLINGGGEPIVVVGTSTIPPNNFFNKKGFLFHNKKVPLFSNKEIHQASCFIPLHDLHFVQNLKRIGTWKEFSPDEQEFLEKMENGVNDLDFGRAKDYCDQISIVNSYLWKKIFSEDLRQNVPDLFYLTQENLMRSLTSEMLKAKNIISQAIFDKETREKVSKAFDGVICCWDTEKNKGTHFFWRKTDKNDIERLLLRGDELVSENGEFKIKLVPEDLIPLIEQGVILPSSFIIYAFMNFWCGVKPLVGHGSSTYLTRMKEAWLKVLDDKDEVERISEIDTKGLVGGSVVTFKREGGKLAEQYAFDVIYAGGLSGEYLNKLFNMKFSDLLGPALLGMYETYVPVDERQNLGLKASDMVGPEFDWIK